MSLSRLNAWIARTFPKVSARLYKGEGYFYWIDADGYERSDVYNDVDHEWESIYVCHFSQATMDWWKGQVQTAMDAYAKAAAEANIHWTDRGERELVHARSRHVPRTDANLDWQNTCEFPEADRVLPANAVVGADYLWGYCKATGNISEPIDVRVMLDEPMTGREASNVLMDLYRWAMEFRMEVPRDAYVLEQVDEVPTPNPGTVFHLFYGT